ncbi:HAD-IC family P-type ATPase [bacterium]|nr:HAD-IC family P-type ATPase [bacterium]
MSEVLTKLCGGLETDPIKGLSGKEAEQRLCKFGLNEIVFEDKFAYVKMFFSQFQSAVVILLLVAQAVSFLAGEVLQAVAILFALLVNALIGFATEIKAKISIKSLESLMKPNARVVRDGTEHLIEARQLVPGDIVLISAGDSVPADLKLIDTADLRLDESTLSGESAPVYKTATKKQNQHDSSLDENYDEAFQGTIVQTGRARGVVYATGLHTKIGNLGRLLFTATSNKTPLEQNLDTMGAQLSKYIIVACVILFFVGLMHDESPWSMVQVCIALAVAAIPEGMPVIATLALAAGTRKMARKGALVRKLPAVETLGCTAIICSDKTGTLTENQMMVSDVVTYNQHFKLEGQGYEPSGHFFDPNNRIENNHVQSFDSLNLLLKAASLCNDAKLENHDGQTSWHIHGDPTEGALLTAAAKAGLNQNELSANYKRVAELPFSIDRKMMSTLHLEPDGKRMLFVKGSPESVLKKCSYFKQDSKNNENSPFTKQIETYFKEQNHILAKLGLRVLAVAYKQIDSAKDFTLSCQTENELTLLGLIAMSDQVRPQVEEAVQACHRAGIKIIMITGDQPATAHAIATKLKLGNGTVLIGKEVEQMSDAELKMTLEHSYILARTTPEIKMRIVKTLQESGQVVAMTGDGVNDAPALRQADVGIAMGKNGTDLAREACDLVLTDDNFATITHAIREGRIIYSNIRKSVAYLLTASFSSVLVVAFNVLFHCGFYLNPIQLLWLNLIMHIFPGLALALERSDTAIMNQPPRPKNEALLSKSTYKQIWLRSMLTAIVVAFVTFNLENKMPNENLTIGFSLLSFLLLAQAWSWIYWSDAGFTLPMTLPRANTFLCMFVSYLFLLVAIFVPGLNTILGLKPIAISWFVAAFVVATTVALLIDLVALCLLKIKCKKRLPCV